MTLYDNTLILSRLANWDIALSDIPQGWFKGNCGATGFGELSMTIVNLKKGKGQHHIREPGRGSNHGKGY
jgi:hypothetical protein